MEYLAHTIFGVILGSLLAFAWINYIRYRLARKKRELEEYEAKKEQLIEKAVGETNNTLMVEFKEKPYILYDIEKDNFYNYIRPEGMEFHIHNLYNPNRGKFRNVEYKKCIYVPCEFQQVSMDNNKANYVIKSMDFNEFLTFKQISDDIEDMFRKDQSLAISFNHSSTDFLILYTAVVEKP